MEKRISEIAGDVLRDGSIGLWIIQLDEGVPPKMFGDDRMKALIGADDDMTPEEVYNAWYSNVNDEYYGQVEAVVKRMSEGIHSEIQYPWHDSVRGYIKVRCGGTRDFSYTNGVRLQGYHQDITTEDDAILAQINENTEKKLHMVEQLSSEQLAILTSISKLYYSMHLINLMDESVVEYNTNDYIDKYINKSADATTQLQNVMSNAVIPEHQEAIFEFIDLKTLPRRLKNKMSVSDEFIGYDTGWFVAEFIKIDEDDCGNIKNVLFTTKIIDDQKKREARLIRMSNTDGLTGLNNRRCYEEKIKSFKGIPKEDSFVLIAMDVNSLKNTNDTLGHDAGDELLVGASKCMIKTFARYGSVFRIGGDEFVAIIDAEEKRLNQLIKDFDERVSNWKGTMVDSLSVSYGYVTKIEFPNMTVENMAKIADKRMYEAKTNYYIANGLDRRKR